jgi:hypothetical protein
MNDNDNDNTLRGALLLATGNAQLTERGHALVNRHVATLLAEGLITYGTGRKAYSLTFKGLAFLNGAAAPAAPAAPAATTRRRDDFAF